MGAKAAPRPHTPTGRRDKIQLATFGRGVVCIRLRQVLYELLSIGITLLQY